MVSGNYEHELREVRIGGKGIGSRDFATGSPAHPRPARRAARQRASLALSSHDMMVAKQY
jgi:hypothetical protein